MKEQIEQLKGIVDRIDLQVLIGDYRLASQFDGVARLILEAIARLQIADDNLNAILARQTPENGSERLETPNTGTFDEGYDAGFQAALKEMRNV
jgi:hypothetical protein